MIIDISVSGGCGDIQVIRMNNNIRRYSIADTFFKSGNDCFHVCRRLFRTGFPFANRLIMPCLCLIGLIEELRQFTGRQIWAAGADKRKAKNTVAYRFISKLRT